MVDRVEMTIECLDTETALNVPKRYGLIGWGWSEYIRV